MKGSQSMHRLQRRLPSDWMPLFFRFALCFVFAGVLPAQEYCWPTDASRLMTSSFGEYRPGHFHAGLDVKTWGREGYRVFAAADGSIVQVRVSPYGYGRVVYCLSDKGMTTVYAHLSRFSDRIEYIIKEEQKRSGRFAVERYLRPGSFRVQKGDLIGFTGSTGNGVPHLHFEVRDSLNRPFNPLALNLPVEDSVPPTMTSVAVSPLSFGSHVDGDFQPKNFSLTKRGEGAYSLNETITGWGRLGFSVSVYDRANGASNQFSPYGIRFFVDGRLVFGIRYDRFSYDRSSQVELDRDYRLKMWGWGLFHKLFRDTGNELLLHELAGMNAGILCCVGQGMGGTDLAGSSGIVSEEADGIVIVEEGEHAFLIEAVDYFGNVSEVRGDLRIVPMVELFTDSGAGVVRTGVDPWTDNLPNRVELEKHFFEEYIRFRVRSERPLIQPPEVSVEINSWHRMSVPMVAKNDCEYIGAYPLESASDGTMITELRFLHGPDLEQVVRDTIQVFRISPSEGGTILSPDGMCKVVFPRHAVYKSFFGFCNQSSFFRPDGIVDRQYTLFPQDIPLKGRVKVFMGAQAQKGGERNVSIYAIGREGRASYMGGQWENGGMAAWTGSLSNYTILQDTVPPEIRSISPRPDSHLRDRTPRIAIGFADTLSGISGEDNYIIRLDGIRLIVEYRPFDNLGFHLVEEPLGFGEHVLDVTIRDRAGNMTKRRSRFNIDP